MASPGWYQDPEDATWQQYFDGQRWTGDRRPADPPAPPPVTPPPVTPPPAPVTPSYPTQQWDQPQWGQPAPQQWGQPPAPQQPAPPQWGQPAPQQWNQPGWAAGPPPQRRNRVPLIIALVVVVVAGLGVGGFFLFKSDSSPSFTFDGQAIDNPDQPLKQAGTTVESLVKARHGAKSDNTRCYYAVPDQPAPDAKKTDIDHFAWCGPVVFIDGAADKQYLRFQLSSQPAKSGKVAVTPSTQPTSDAPEAVPSSTNLKRPDNAHAPSGAGGLKVPPPPAAAPDTLIATDVGKEAVPAAPSTAVIGGVNGGVTVTKLGPVKRYGTGDDARSTPDSHRLIAFQLDGALGNDGTPANLSRSASVSIDGGAARRLPVGNADQYIVVAVPNAAHAVDLVLADSGIRQTLSLLNGKPAASNIKVLARSHRVDTIGRTSNFTFTFSQPVVFPDGSSGSSQTGTLSVPSAQLYYTIPSKHAKASGPGRALLYIDVGYTVKESPGRDFGFEPAMMTFTPSGKGPIRARNVASSGLIYDIFEVPANLTSGTLRISGSFVSTFANTGNKFRTTLAAPITVRVSFPAN